MAFREQQKSVSNLLRGLRMSAGLRQIDVADHLGVPQSFVSKYESGERRLDIVEIRSLCKLFGISLTEFVKRLDEAQLRGSK